MNNFLNNGFYTKNHVEVTKRIKQGKTHFIEGTGLEEKQLAEDYAKSQRSYIYDMYGLDKRGRKRRIGFGIPK